jgi:hypothetical protein
LHLARALIVLLTGTAIAGPLTGVPVHTVLQEIEARGLTLIYSSDVVSPDMRVMREPAAVGDLELVEAILEPYGLELRPAGDSAWSVVRGPRAGMPGTLRGKAVDARTGRPIRDVAISIAAATATSQADGRFTVDNLPAGLYQLVATHPDYRRGRLSTVPIAAGQRADLTVELAPGVLPLEEIVVSTSRYSLGGDTPAPHAFISHQEIVSLPKAADEPLKAVQRLPGAASNGISGLAHMRGGEENETLVVLDGMALAEPFHLRNLLSPVSVLDASIVDALQVYAGGFPATYGGHMSALVEVGSVPADSAPRYELGLSLFHANVLGSGSFDGERGRWLLAGRRSNLDELADLLESDIGDAHYLDSFGRLDYRLATDTWATLSFLASQDSVKLNEKDMSEKADAKYDNLYLWTTIEHRWSDRLTGRALLSFTDVNNERNGTVADPAKRSGTVEDDRSYRVGALKLEVEAGDDQLLYMVGASADSLRASYRYNGEVTFAADYPFPGDPPRTISRAVSPAPDGYALAAWVNSRWRWSPRLVSELGIRWDEQTYDRVDGGTQLGPRASMLYEASDRLRYRASWGRFFQAQRINELQVEDGVDTFYAAQRADHFIVGVDRDFDDGISLRLEAYYKDYDELRPRYENLFDPVVLIPELEADRVLVAPTAARARGAELLLKRRADDPWSWWASYGWSRAEDTVNGSDVARSWDQRHTINAGVNWARGPWDLTLAGSWHTGWPTTPVRRVPGDGGAIADQVVVGDRNSDRYADFGSVDIRAAYTFELDNSELVTFIDLINVLGRRNPCCTDYSVLATGPGTLQLLKDQDYWVRFLPNIGVTWKY